MSTATRMPRLFAAGLALWAGCALEPARAEDTDIFSAPGGGGGLPNVLIVLDSSANWGADLKAPNCYYNEDGVPTTRGPKATTPNQEQGKKIALEKCALYNVIDALPLGPDGGALVAVGIMLFNESGTPAGGYPRHALVPVDKAAKRVLKDAVAAIAIDADKANNGPFGRALYEAFRYLSARQPYRGHLGEKYDRTAFSGGRYVATQGHGCGRDAIILLANGSPNEGSQDEVRELLRADGADVTELTYLAKYVYASDQANWSDEAARFFAGTDVSGTLEGRQSVTTHTIAVTEPNRDPRYPNYLRAIATQGGGIFREASSVQAIVDGLTAVFNQVIAANTVFASASLPISVNARGTYRNQIFMGMLRPDAGPRWAGNLKQYRFGYDPATDSLEIVDAAGNTAISDASGFVDPGAVSFWTTPSNFWVNARSGTPPSASDSPDGDIVEKGGAAQRLRELYADDQDGRKVYTCVGCTNVRKGLGTSVATEFSTGNASVSRALLGAATDTERDLIIDWVRGTDNANDEKGPGGGVTVRPSIHGDVLHSRPAVITYGDRVVVYYGANDGMLHAIEGTQAADVGGHPLWGFVPEEVFPKLKRLRDNLPVIKYPNTPASLTATPRDYYVDGNVSVYQKLDANGDVEKAIIYFGMRRGGRVVYALDVTVPERPVFLWKKNSTDIPVLGQTWSEPKVARLKHRTNPVIIMGAGYDRAEDLDPAGATTMGNAVLVLDAFTGDVLRSFEGLPKPVPADVALVDSDFDGYVDRGYAVDLGGYVYRLDFEASAYSDPGNWTITRFAALAGSGGYKFFFPPDVVIAKDYAVVLVGSGDREKPLKTTSSDHFFTLLDRNVGKSVSSAFRTITFDDLVDREDYSTLTPAAGCALALDPAGEKVVNASVTVAGTTYFSTNQPTPPAANSCTSDLGTARSYAVPLLCGLPKVNELDGGGLPPSPVTGVVEIQVAGDFGSGDGEVGEGPVRTRLVPFIIGGDNSKKSAIEGSKVRPPIKPRRSKLYWFFDRDR